MEVFFVLYSQAINFQLIAINVGIIRERQKNGEKAYEERCRYHCFVILVASKEKDTNRALEKYRSREYVEEDFENSKSHAGGNHPRVWDDDTLDGQILVQFLAQSMHESFASMLRNLRDTLAIPNGDVKHDTGEKLKEEKQLKNWIRKTSMHNILPWFDAIEETKVPGKKKNGWRILFVQPC